MDKKYRIPIPLNIKKLVWNKYIGEEIGKAKCYCCRFTDIVQISFHCGHIVSNNNGGNTEVENLRPICQNCNSSIGSKNMNEFMENYGLKKPADAKVEEKIEEIMPEENQTPSEETPIEKQGENFECSVCKKKYASKDGLTKHQRKVHNIFERQKREKKDGENCYHCRTCDKYFTRIPSRWKHEKKCKNKPDTIDENLSKMIIDYENRIQQIKQLQMRYTLYKNKK
jgi:hypothetical protein